MPYIENRVVHDADSHLMELPDVLDEEDVVDVDLGAASHHEGEAAMNSLLASRARRVIVIADSSKLGKHAFARVCPIDKVHTLVTDADATQADLDPFLAAGLEVFCV